ncbi:hypothetical protein D9M68_670930 [compost metagenome]
MQKRFLPELLIVFLLGGVPVTLSYFLGGSSELGTTITSLLANELAINYAFSLSIIFFTVAFLEWFLLKRSETSKKAWAFSRSILSEVGTGALSILRVGAGVLLTFPLLWLAADPATFKFSKVFHYFIYGGAAFFEGMMLSTAHQYVKRWERKAL